MSYCKDCPNWRHSTARPNYCQVLDWSSEPTDFCSFEDREPETKKGEWKWIGFDEQERDVFACTKCGHKVHGGDPNFCSQCGADMRGEE